MLARSWPVLYEAQQHGRLATTGPYAYVRHPQYVGFIVIMLGFLLQWPTLLTVVMFPSSHGLTCAWRDARKKKCGRRSVRLTSGTPRRLRRSLPASEDPPQRRTDARSSNS